MNSESTTIFDSMIAVLKKWRKLILMFTIVCTAVAAVVSFFILPKQYYAGTTLLPVNGMVADKGRIFNNNIQELYSVYGNSDDLDRIYSIAKAGIVFGFVVDSLRLVEHYSIDDKTDKGRAKAIKRLKKNTDVLKTENGALQIDVWDKDANAAAVIANCMTYKINLLGNEMLQQVNNRIIEKLQTDSAADKNILYQFKLAASVEQPSVVVLEKAYPSLKPDKPKHLIIITSAFLLSLFFSLLAAIIIDRLKK
jgi:uncharacterized protein involved in exopolysaccharide biosynthesis